MFLLEKINLILYYYSIGYWKRREKKVILHCEKTKRQPLVRYNFELLLRRLILLSLWGTFILGKNFVNLYLHARSAYSWRKSLVFFIVANIQLYVPVNLFKAQKITKMVILVYFFITFVSCFSLVIFLF